MRAPISRRVAISPVRRGFIITPSTTMSEPGTISAATIAKAAEDGSAGTTTGRGAARAALQVIVRPVAPNGSTRTSAPKKASIFSV